MAEETDLLRGSGNELGPFSTALPADQRSLVRMLARRAEDSADREWIVHDDGTLTYADAYGLANRIARAIIATTAAGAHVGVFLRNQVEIMPSFYGIMAAGSVAVPLNADARGPLLQDVIEKSDVRLLIARAEFLDRLAAMETIGEVERIVCVRGPEDEPVPAQVNGVPVTDFEEWIADHPTDQVREFPGHDDLSLIQFTSGTTGRTKGAMFSHHYLFLCSAIVADALQHTPDAVLFTPLPLYHVGAQHIICNAAMHARAKSVLPAKFSAGSYWDEVAACGATSGMLVGPMASILLKTVEKAPPHTMKTVQCVPPPPSWQQFEERFDTHLLWQGYGSTECYPLPPRRFEEMTDSPSDAIGKPVTWMEFGVVDEHDNMLGPGEVGEMVFRPRLPFGMMSGYYKDAEGTVSALRNFMFHTGDQGAYDEDGLLYYRGRMQDRLRRRGENVSAFELELVANGHPDVIEAAAYGIPGEFGEHDIKLDCVVRNDLDAADLHAWLRENLPRYMVPRYLELCESLPKTPSMRIEKYKLAARPLDRDEVWDATGAGVSR
jgi:crotonobetaine/carnitine-CoA ligase